MNRFILLLLLISSFLAGYSQKIVKVSATYTYYAPETMSIEEAKRVALDRAKIQAIADEFGTVVSQSATTMISNKNGETDTQFYAYGGSDVKGEWIETIGNPEYSISFKDHTIIVTCNVEGRIREASPSKLYFESYILRNGQQTTPQKIIFNNGDEMSLSFQASTKGFLSLFWHDVIANTVYRILPYRQDTNSLKEILANRRYLFFSKEMCVDGESEFIDEYIMSCEESVEHNSIYAIFSDNEYPTPNLHLYPSGLYGISNSEVQSWLARIKSTPDDILIKVYDIEIVK